MNLIIAAAAAACFLAILLCSGAYLFGASLGSPTRGAIIPLLVIPLATDWFRFLAKIPFGRAFGLCVLLYLLLAAVLILRRRPANPFSAWPRELRGRWWFVLALYLVIHIILRTWLFTGSVLNPADDSYSGFKSNALLHSPAWPTTLPPLPELPMGYYYYPYEWPAALSYWIKLPLMSSWWATAIMFCVTGSMLCLETVLPKLKSNKNLLFGSLAVLNGCSLSFLLGIALRLPPKDWMQEPGFLAHRFGLYLRVPQGKSAYWAPFAIFSTGLLIIVVVNLWRLARERTLRRSEYVVTALAIASFTGYCTFHLIALLLIVIPALGVAVLVLQRRRALWLWFPKLAAVGAASLLLCLPTFLLLIHRVPGDRVGRFREPLLVWLRFGPQHYGAAVVAGLALWALLGIGISNLLAFPVLFRRTGESLSPFAIDLMILFCVGSIVCCFGVTDDFVPKVGNFVSVTAVLAFLSLERPPKWGWILLVAGLVDPGLGMLDTVRANIVLQKEDPVWKTLDRLDSETHEIVLEDISLEERNRHLWEMSAPYFSRIQLISPVEQVIDQDLNFLVNPAQAKTLPPTAIRLQNLTHGANTYLLLKSGTSAPVGDRLYSDPIFSLERMAAPSAPHS